MLARCEEVVCWNTFFGHQAGFGIRVGFQAAICEDVADLGNVPQVAAD